MNTFRLLALVATFSAAFTMLHAPASAQVPADLRDLIGMRGSSLDSEMESRGYSFARAAGAQFWWNGATRECVSVSTSQGRVARLNAVAADQCGQGKAGSQPAGGSAGGDAAKSSAVRACTDAFGPNGKLGTVSALNPGFWEVIISDRYGRKVACTGSAAGKVEEWAELGKQ